MTPNQPEIIDRETTLRKALGYIQDAETDKDIGVLALEELMAETELFADLVGKTRESIKDVLKEDKEGNINLEFLKETIENEIMVSGLQKIVKILEEALQKESESEVQQILSELEAYVQDDANKLLSKMVSGFDKIVEYYENLASTKAKLQKIIDEIQGVLNKAQEVRKPLQDADETKEKEGVLLELNTNSEPALTGFDEDGDEDDYGDEYERDYDVENAGEDDEGEPVLARPTAENQQKVDTLPIESAANTRPPLVDNDDKIDNSEPPKKDDADDDVPIGVENSDEKTDMDTMVARFNSPELNEQDSLVKSFITNLSKYEGGLGHNFVVRTIEFVDQYSIETDVKRDESDLAKTLAWDMLKQGQTQNIEAYRIIANDFEGWSAEDFKELVGRLDASRTDTKMDNVQASVEAHLPEKLPVTKPQVAEVSGDNKTGFWRGIGRKLKFWDKKEEVKVGEGEDIRKGWGWGGDNERALISQPQPVQTAEENNSDAVTEIESETDTKSKTEKIRYLEKPEFSGFLELVDSDEELSEIMEETLKVLAFKPTRNVPIFDRNRKSLKATLERVLSNEGSKESKQNQLRKVLFRTDHLSLYNRVMDRYNKETA